MNEDFLTLDAIDSLENVVEPELNNNTTSNEITETLLVPESCISRIVGQGGRKIRRLQRFSKCRLTLIKENDTAEATVSGKPSDVQYALALLNIIVSQDKAQRAELEFLKNRDDTTALQLPADVRGLVLGKRGGTKMRVEEDNDVLMYLQEGDEMMDLVIVGSKRSMCGAVMTLLGVMSNARPELRDMFFDTLRRTMADSKLVLETFDLEESMVGRLAGRGGARTRLLSAAACCAVQLVDSQAVLLGYRAEVDTARTFIQLSLGAMRGAPPPTEDGADYNLVHVPSDVAGFVIGSAGRKLKELEETHRCIILHLTRREEPKQVFAVCNSNRHERNQASGKMREAAKEKRQLDDQRYSRNDRNDRSNDRYERNDNRQDSYERSIAHDSYNDRRNDNRQDSYERNIARDSYNDRRRHRSRSPTPEAYSPRRERKDERRIREEKRERDYGGERREREYRREKDYEREKGRRKERGRRGREDRGNQRIFKF